MKALIYAILVCALLTGIATADTAKLTLDAKAMPVKDAAAEISRQAGVAIVVDPKAGGTVTASLNGANLEQTLDVITKSNNLTWKKLQFARKSDSKVTLDQLKAGILALATMPFVGLSVEDPAARSTALYTKSVPAELNPSKLTLPEGYSWSTVYVVLSPEPPVAPPDKDKPAAAPQQAAAQQNIEQQTAEAQKQKQYFKNQLMEQMSLTPAARRSLMRTLPPEYRAQLRQDMQAVFGKTTKPPKKKTKK